MFSTKNIGKVRYIQASRGLKGRALGHEGQKVVLDDGTIAAGAYHIFADGGGVVAKADETGYYYMCNSETGMCKHNNHNIHRRKTPSILNFLTFLYFRSTMVSS